MYLGILIVNRKLYYLIGFRKGNGRMVFIFICGIVALVMPWLNILYLFVLYMLCVGKQVAK